MKDFSSHLKSLKDRHAKLERDIQKIETRAFVNEIQLHEMKKRKLKVKEEIGRLDHGAKHIH